MSNAVNVVKLATTTVVGIGTSRIVKAIITNNVSTDGMSLIEETTVVASSYVLGAMVADATKKYTDAKVEAAATWIANKRNKLNQKS
jgi:hypothetical protein